MPLMTSQGECQGRGVALLFNSAQGCNVFETFVRLLSLIQIWIGVDRMRTHSQRRQGQAEGLTRKDTTSARAPTSRATQDKVDWWRMRQGCEETSDLLRLIVETETVWITTKNSQIFWSRRLSLQQPRGCNKLVIMRGDPRNTVYAV